MKAVKTGFAVLTNMSYGYDLMWCTENENGEDTPLVFDTEVEAFKEIADTMIHQLQDFIDGNRELEDTEFATDEIVCQYEQFENGEILVTGEDGNPIIETTLEQWQAKR